MTEKINTIFNTVLSKIINYDYFQLKLRIQILIYLIE